MVLFLRLRPEVVGTHSEVSGKNLGHGELAQRMRLARPAVWVLHGREDHLSENRPGFGERSEGHPFFDDFCCCSRFHPINRPVTRSIADGFRFGDCLGML